MRSSTGLFRENIMFALEWELTGAVTLKALAAHLGATIPRVRYHALALVAQGSLQRGNDPYGRVLVSIPQPLDEFLDQLLAA